MNVNASEMTQRKGFALKVMANVLRDHFKDAPMEIANNNFEMLIRPNFRNFMLVVSVKEFWVTRENQSLAWHETETMKKQVLFDSLMIIVPDSHDASAAGSGAGCRTVRNTQCIYDIISFLTTQLQEPRDTDAAAAAAALVTGFPRVLREKECSDDPFDISYCNDGMTSRDLEMFRNDVLTLV